MNVTHMLIINMIKSGTKVHIHTTSKYNHGWNKRFQTLFHSQVTRKYNQEWKKGLYILQCANIITNETKV